MNAATPRPAAPRNATVSVMSIRHALLTSVTAAAILLPRPSSAVIPVFDEVANSQFVIQVEQGVQQLANWSTQLKAMVDLITLQNVMNTVLGEGLGTAFSDLLTSVQTLYDSGAGAYYSIANLQNRLMGEMSLFLPPAGGYGSMTTEQMLWRARRIAEFTTQNNAAAAMWQSRAVDRANLAIAQAQQGAAQSARAVSAVSAVQAANHILAAQAQQLDFIGRSAALLATNLEAKMQEDLNSRGMVNAQARRDIEAMEEALGRGQAMPGISPSSWH